MNFPPRYHEAVEVLARCQVLRAEDGVGTLTIIGSATNEPRAVLAVQDYGDVESYEKGRFCCYDTHLVEAPISRGDGRIITEAVLRVKQEALIPDLVGIPKSIDLAAVVVPAAPDALPSLVYTHHRPNDNFGAQGDRARREKMPRVVVDQREGELISYEFFCLEWVEQGHRRALRRDDRDLGKLATTVIAGAEPDTVWILVCEEYGALYIICMDTRTGGATRAYYAHGEWAIQRAVAVSADCIMIHGSKEADATQACDIYQLRLPPCAPANTVTSSRLDFAEATADLVANLYKFPPKAFIIPDPTDPESFAWVVQSDSDSAALVSAASAESTSLVYRCHKGKYTLVARLPQGAKILDGHMLPTGVLVLATYACQRLVAREADAKAWKPRNKPAPRGGALDECLLLRVGAPRDWTQGIHAQYPRSFRRRVRALLALRVRFNTDPEASRLGADSWSALPWEILEIVIEKLVAVEFYLGGVAYDNVAGLPTS